VGGTISGLAQRHRQGGHLVRREQHHFYTEGTLPTERLVTAAALSPIAGTVLD